MSVRGAEAVERRPAVPDPALLLRRASGPAAAAAAALVLALLVPGMVGAAWLSTLTSCAIFAIAASGTGVLYGWLGLTSLTQVALVGAGGWLMLRLEFAVDLPFLLQVLAAAALTSVLGLLLALPALRVRGLALALVTVLVAGGFDVVFNAVGFPNGGPGFLGYSATGDLQRIGRPAIAMTDEGYFRLVVAVALVALLAVRWQLAGRAGRGWALIARSEAGALSAGLSVPRLQARAFALAAGLCGVAGALLAGQLGQLAPATFQVSESLLLFGLVVIAGAHHWAGWLLAAVLYKVVPFALSEAGVEGHIATLAFGAALMASMLGSPHGVVGQVQELWIGLRERRA